MASFISEYLPGIKDRLIKDGVTGKDLLSITRKGKLEETLAVVKRSDGAVVWLEKGNLDEVDAFGKDKGGMGWQHIQYNHVYHGRDDERFATQLGSKYSSEEEVLKLIMDGAKYGTDGGKPGRLYKIYNVPGTTKQIQVGLSKKGEIITAYPLKSTMS